MTPYVSDGFARGHLSGGNDSIRANLEADRNFAHMVSLGLRVTF